jgi:hypothetical protein
MTAFYIFIIGYVFLKKNLFMDTIFYRCYTIGVYGRLAQMVRVLA